MDFGVNKIEMLLVPLPDWLRLYDPIPIEQFTRHEQKKAQKQPLYIHHLKRKY